MLYQTWNFRYLPFFKEEMVEQNSEIVYPSIEEFKQEKIYSSEIRHALKKYISQCPNIVATSSLRYNPYLEITSHELAYYTDGEIIFNNFLFDYIIHEDFAIPSKWLEIIKGKNFIMDPILIDYDKLSDPAIDIFMMTEQTFEMEPLIKQFLL